MTETVITNTPGRDDSSGALGWIVALIVILAVIVAGYLWVQRAPTPVSAGTNINVDIPTGGTAQ